jgi:hypothetical protein
MAGKLGSVQAGYVHLSKGGSFAVPDKALLEEAGAVRHEYVDDPIMGNAVIWEYEYAFPKGEDVKRVLLSALGFTDLGEKAKKGGPHNPFQRFEEAIGDVLAAARVRVLVDGDGQTPTNAYYLVGKEIKESESSVRRAWEQFKDLVRRGDLEEQRKEVARPDTGVRRPPFTN